MQVGAAGGGGSGGGGGGWSWEGLTGWTRRHREGWRPHPTEWVESAGQAAEDLRQWASWETFQGWQERHWRSFEERQRQRLASLTEEQRQAWAAWEERQRARLGELAQEGEQLLKRELGAFEEWQRRYYEAQHPQEAAQRRPACRQFRLSYLMLPLLLNFRESLGHFGKRTKVARADWGGVPGRLMFCCCSWCLHALFWLQLVACCWLLLPTADGAGGDMREAAYPLGRLWSGCKPCPIYFRPPAAAHCLLPADGAGGRDA